MSYWYHGQERRETLGEFPAVKLREAREATAQIRYKLSRGKDPRGECVDDLLPSSPTFGDIAAEWLKKAQSESTSAKYRDVLEYRIKKYVLGSIGGLPIADAHRA